LIAIRLLQSTPSVALRGAARALASATLLGLLLASLASAASADQFAPYGSDHHGPWPGPIAPPWHEGKPEAPPPPSSCTTTITGAVNGRLIVPTGQWYCLKDAQVRGSVVVLPGAGVTVEGSTIDGGVSAYRAVNVRVCTSTVNGPTTAVAGSGTVLMGDAGDDGATDCNGNTLHGPVTIICNHGAVELGEDVITGPVTLIGNEGPAFSGSDVGAEVELNEVYGPLICKFNSPEPTNDGLKNTVSGPELGQCAGF